MAATGTYAFVGSAQGALKVNDLVTGQLLAAGRQAGRRRIDQERRLCGNGAAENAMDYWGNEIDQRLVFRGVQPSSSTASN